MEFIFKYISTEKLIQDSAAIILSLLVGFLIWITKQSYEKYSKELTLLKNLEVTLSYDLAVNKDNEVYLLTWEKQLETNRLYSCSFRKYKLDSSQFANLSNNNLVTKINTLNYCIDGFSLDISNIYENYTICSFKMLEKDLISEWRNLNKNTKQQLKTFKTNSIESEKDIKECIAYLRVYYRQRRFTFFRLFHWMEINIFPIITEKKINEEIKEIEEELKKKKNADTEEVN